MFDETRAGRRFRLHLHREVAARAWPDDMLNPEKLRVVARNGDYFDARRINLEIVVWHRGKGAADGRPEGAKFKPYRGKRELDEPKSQLWTGGVHWMRFGPSRKYGPWRPFLGPERVYLVEASDGRGPPVYSFGPSHDRTGGVGLDGQVDRQRDPPAGDSSLGEAGSGEGGARVAEEPHEGEAE